MMQYNTTRHFSADRADRAAYIAQTVGFGEIVDTIVIRDRAGRLANYQIMETGVVIIVNNNNQIVTMFLMTSIEVKRYYGIARKQIPSYLMKKVRKNEQEGYIRNQPGER